MHSLYLLVKQTSAWWQWQRTDLCVGTLFLFFLFVFSLLPLLATQTLQAAAQDIGVVSAPQTVRSSNMRLLGHIGGPIQRVVTQGDYTYIATQFAVSILNTSDPSQPQRVGTILLPWLKDIAVAGDMLYVTLWEDKKLAVIDLADRSAPRQIGTVDLPGLPDGMVLNGPLLYILSFLEGGQVINVANPAEAQIVGGFMPNISLRRGIMRDQLLVVASNNMLRIFDTSNPLQPALKGEVGFPGLETRSLHLAGNLAYVAQFNKTFVIDISNSLAPSLLTTLSISELLAVDSAHLYVQSRNSADSYPVTFYSVADPLQPVEVATMPFSAFISEIQVTNHRASVASDGGFFLVDFSSPTVPLQQGRWWGGSDIRQAEVVGNYLYLRDGLLEEMALIDIADPTQPVPIGALDVLSRSEGLKVDGNIVYIGRECTFPCRSGFSLHSRLNPLTLQQVGSYDTPMSGFLLGGPVQSFVAADNLAYIATTNSLRVVDMSDPTQPADLGGYAAALSDLHIQGNFLFGVHLQGFQNELHVIDVSDPAQPTLTASLPISSGHDFDLQDQRIYIADRDPAEGLAGLRIIDITDPSQPRQIGQFLFELARNAQTVAVDGDLAYVGVEHTGSGIDTVRVIDIRDPAQPHQIDSFELLGPESTGFSLAEVKDITAHNGLLYVSESQGGLFILAYPTSNSSADSRLEAPDVVQGPAGQPVPIPIAINNSGILTATQVAITVTLANGVSYVSNSLGAPATQSAQQLTWLLSDLPPFAPIQMNLQVMLPTTRQAHDSYSITVEIATTNGDSAPANNQVEIVLKTLPLPSPSLSAIYLPLVSR